MATTVGPGPFVGGARRWLSAAAVVLLVAGAASCAPPPDPPPLAEGLDPDTAPQAGEAAYAQEGPYEVGVTTLSLGDRDVEVWYPADPAGIGDTPQDVYYIRDYAPSWLDALIPADVDPPFVTSAHRGVPASTEGPFPLVLFSHGFASFRTASSQLSSHIASWGFVVVAPDYLERGLKGVLGEGPANPRPDTVVADEAIDAAAAAGAEIGGLLEGAVDSSAIYPVGHSAGGGTSLRLLQRDDVSSAIPLASGISLSSIMQGNAVQLPAGKSIFWVGARNDGVADSENVRTGYLYTPGEKKVLEIGGAGHNNAFTDICEIGDGGVAALAVATGLPVPDFLINLGNDGCPVPPFKESAEVWPEANHFVTAELRYRSGLDPLPVGLGEQVESQFDDIVDYRHAP